jgi:hypothetical protein
MYPHMALACSSFNSLANLWSNALYTFLNINKSIIAYTDRDIIGIFHLPLMTSKKIRTGRMVT